MFNFVSKSSLCARVYSRLFSRSLSSSSSSSPAPNSLSKSSNQDSFTESYLINTCGFSPAKALTVSKYVKLKTPDRADSVLAFFKDHGFTKTQVSNLVRRFPRVLLLDAEKCLLPKLEFFSSKGLLSNDLVKYIVAKPNILGRSLENHIMPSFNFIRGLLQSDEKALNAMKRSAQLLAFDFENCISPNIQILRELGVPGSNIVFLLANQPRALLTSTENFKRMVEEVMEMGFNPLTINFVLAIHAVRSMSKSTWENKVEVYKKWGLSEDEIFTAFRRNPWCMMKSEEKIDKVMDFFTSKMSWSSSLVVKRSLVISFSLEKRIIPRCFVYQYLLEKGLINKKKDSGFTWFLRCSEVTFLKRIKKGYEKEAPELLRLYQAKLDLAN